MKIYTSMMDRDKLVKLNYCELNGVNFFGRD
jgi:hypothetical protein